MLRLLFNPISIRSNEATSYVTRTSRVWIGLTATVLGVGLIVWGGQLGNEHAYISSLLGNIGTAFLLAVPLILLERLLERRLEQTEAATERSIENLGIQIQEVNATVSGLSERLQEVSRRTSERITTQRAEAAAITDAPAARVADEATFESVHEGLAVAKGEFAIKGPVYVGLREEQAVLRFTNVIRGRGKGVEVKVWARDANPHVEQCIWYSGEPVDELFSRVDDSLRKLHGTEAPVLDAGHAINELAVLLRVSMRRVATLGASYAPNYPKVLSTPNERWIVLDDGLFHVRTKRVISVKFVRGSVPGYLNLPADVPDQEDLDFVFFVANRCYLDQPDN